MLEILRLNTGGPSLLGADLVKNLEQTWTLQGSGNLHQTFYNFRSKITQFEVTWAILALNVFGIFGNFCGYMKLGKDPEPVRVRESIPSIYNFGSKIGQFEVIWDILALTFPAF